MEIKNDYDLISEFNTKLLNYTWNLIEFDGNSLNIQINFNNPLYVSQGKSYDIIIFYVKEDLFMSTKGKKLNEKSKVLRHTIPR